MYMPCKVRLIGCGFEIHNSLNNFVNSKQNLKPFSALEIWLPWLVVSLAFCFLALGFQLHSIESITKKPPVSAL
jgi:hypothetical protein